MAKRVTVARKAKDRWKSKVWYSLHAPAMFDYAVITQTPTNDPARVSGRVAKVPLQHITGDHSQKNFMVHFQVGEVRGFGAFTHYIGHRLTSDYMRALTRRKHTRVDANFAVTTSDGVRVRVKPLVIMDRRVQTTQERAIRAQVVKQVSARLEQATLAEGLKLIFSGEIGRELAKTLRVIYPTKRVEIGKMTVLDPAQLMEVPPSEEELERILSGEAEAEEPDEVDEALEADVAVTADDTDYDALTVPQLKALLADRDLPVSGIKAVLIARLREAGAAAGVAPAEAADGTAEGAAGADEAADAEESEAVDDEENEAAGDETEPAAEDADQTDDETGADAESADDSSEGDAEGT